MITVHINDASREFDSDIPVQWLHEQINNRRGDGQEPCVRVEVRTPDVQVDLATAGCGGAGGGGRAARGTENRIIDLWRKHKLQEGIFATGSLIAFLEQVTRLP